MQFIDQDQEHIISALKIHVEELLPVLTVRIKNCNIDYLKDFFEKNIELILKGKPEELNLIQTNLYVKKPNFKTYIDEKRKTKYYDQVIRDEYSPYFVEIQKIIDYDYFTEKSKRVNEYDAYRLAENLNINTCTYCNRLYTKTVINQKINGELSKLTRPTFDHWFPQSKHPLLALSFYNLIPSCTVCNSSLKGSVDMTLNSYLHPYVDKEINFQFSYKLNAINEYEFVITNIGDDINLKSKNTSDFFKLKDIYETHIDEIEDLVKIKKAYSVTYLKNLKEFFKNSHSLSNAEIYRLAFGTEINEARFEKRPLSRMKRDILVELGMI